MRECSPPQTCHMSCVTCHVSRVTCHVSHVTCHLSHVTCHMSKKNLQFFYESLQACLWLDCNGTFKIFSRGLGSLTIKAVKGLIKYMVDLETMLMLPFPHWKQWWLNCWPQLWDWTDTNKSYSAFLESVPGGQTCLGTYGKTRRSHSRLAGGSLV